MYVPVIVTHRPPLPTLPHGFHWHCYHPPIKQSQLVLRRATSLCVTNISLLTIAPHTSIFMMYAIATIPPHKCTLSKVGFLILKNKHHSTKWDRLLYQSQHNKLPQERDHNLIVDTQHQHQPSSSDHHRQHPIHHCGVFQHDPQMNPDPQLINLILPSVIGIIVSVDKIRMVVWQKFVFWIDF